MEKFFTLGMIIFILQFPDKYLSPLVIGFCLGFLISHPLSSWTYPVLGLTAITTCIVSSYRM